MPLSLGESQVITEMAEMLYDFLPGKPHPYANQSISFAGVAHKLGLSQFWTEGSKLPAITFLLEGTLQHRKNQFCNLALEIVRKGLIYRANKGKPITREEIERLNQQILRLSFKVPELWDPSFLRSLPSEKPKSEEITSRPAILAKLKNELLELEKLGPQARGFAFEKFLQTLFALYGLAPHSSFKLIGEQIDGSFQLDGETYLVEAKWQVEQTRQADLLIFREKVENKAVWARGIFISHSGFTEDGLIAFSRGRATNIVGMTGQDLFFILNGDMYLDEALRKKIRRAAETGQFLVTVYEFSLEG